MAALPTNEEILEQYFQSDDEDSEFEGFSEPESDVDIPNALNSSDEEPPDSDDDSENDDETWTDRFCNVEIQDFTQATGRVFTDNFDVENASPKDYFDLMFSPEVVGDMVRHTNNYARWKMEQKGEVDALWYDVTENELRAYLGVNIIMGINELPSYKDYWSRDKFIGNEGIKSTYIVRRYEKITEYFHVSDRENEPERGDQNYDKLYKVRPIVDMSKLNFLTKYNLNKNVTIDETYDKMDRKTFL